MSLTTKRIAQNAIVAGLYFILTLVSAPLSYGLIQFRFSEMLMLLCFFRKDYVIGLTIGCVLANISMSGTMLGGSGWIDMLVGSSATLLAGLIMPYTKRLFISSLIPVITNGIIVGLELRYIFEIDSLGACMGFVALGEFVCISIIGYFLILLLRKTYKDFNKIIDADRNLEVKW